MFRRVWTAAVLLATALGFAAATAGPATAGIGRASSTTNTTRTTRPPTSGEHAMHRPTKDHVARILVSSGAIYFATLLLLIFQP